MYKDALIDQQGKQITIFDLNWFAIHVNDSVDTFRAYNTFVDSYLHEFESPGKSFYVADLVGDPRLFTFLRQQVDELHNIRKLDQILVDTLIIYVLRNTDPANNSFLSKKDIIANINQLVKFDTHSIEDKIKERLEILSNKPRRIQYFSDKDAYCLVYEERLKIRTDNLDDIQLFEASSADTLALINKVIPKELSAKIDFSQLVADVLNSLYYTQGVEFSDFIFTGMSGSSINDLEGLISNVVDQCVFPNTTEIKRNLLVLMRALVYQGTDNQKLFLRKLSLTYSMLFLLQCDPKICAYFYSLAGKLQIYVDNAVIIPALSERFQPATDRRFTNLLHYARDKGVKLIINETILRELVTHFRSIRAAYDAVYSGNDSLYSEDVAIYLIPQIMIRAYYYSLKNGQVKSFEQFLGNFISPKMNRLEEDLVSWLSAEFGIEYLANSTLGLHLDTKEIESIAIKLSQHKVGSDAAIQQKAFGDATTLVTIFELRRINNEINSANISGYKTWWLTLDTNTQKAAIEVNKGKYSIGFCMRPDFLYNYISVSPSKSEVDAAFENMFPTFLGVNISTNLPNDVAKVIHEYVKEHASIGKSRMVARIGELVDDLKQDPSKETVGVVKDKINSWKD
jgi:hypothetical protein